ncbi:hypothetical protein ES708_19501 [subsurface metagenome]
MGLDTIWFGLLIILFILSMTVMLLAIELRTAIKERDRWQQKYFDRFLKSEE